MGNSADHPLLDPFLGCYDELARFLTRKLGCKDLAAELVHETYLRITRIAPSEQIANPRAFFFRMAANLAIDHQRKASYRTTCDIDGEMPLETADHRPTAEAVVFGKQQVDLLIQAVGELPPKCREVFILHKFKHLSYADIAERLDISRSTVVKHMVKALDYCKRRVEGDL
ncbi:DNA-directed RNA polymerase sigma-70 factor [Nitrospira sp. KM1]|uniref:sigma-70 family RNA polymerase sigma factor n=1 Tax=Nitrospira sp. KM1 TaxID=1936990 RepID=UPI0013A7941D|nr:sigma-70 family RNA polymerase sigma factor [Nitrospira sp. KM1]BCA56579.1 DNA-directed RNA polymerase sigma-70 factor [Nitrospira sp. KM1]